MRLAEGVGWLALVVLLSGAFCVASGDASTIRPRPGRININNDVQQQLIINSVGKKISPSLAKMPAPNPDAPLFDYPWPGLRSLFSVTGFTQAAEDLRSIVEDAIRQISIGKLSGSIGTPIGIDIDYDLYNIHLSQWVFGPLTLQVVSDPAANDGVIRVHMSGMSFRVDTDWHYSALFISGSGSATVNVRLNMDIDLVLLNKNGEPQLLTGSVNPNVEDFDVSVHGGASWFYGVFVDIFKGKIKDAFVSGIKSGVADAISRINNQYFSTFPVKMPVNSIVGINYGLVIEPVNPYIASYGAVTDHVGRFYWLDGNVNCPFPASEMIPDLDQLGNRNLQLLVHQSLVTSFGCAYLAAGKLELTLDQSSIPPNFPVQLNTSYWQFFLPNLYFKFPNAAMKFEVKATEVPITTINKTALGEAMVFNTTCYAIPSNGTQIPAFTLGTAVELDFTADISKGNLTANFTSFVVKLRLLDSVVGSFDVSLLQSLAEFVVSDIFLPILNAYGKQGIPLAYISSDSLHLSATKLTFQPGYAVISTNFTVSLDEATRSAMKPGPDPEPVIPLTTN